MPLTPRQERFVAEYLVDLNATRAAIRAGYSPKTANKNAARLMVNDGVKAAIEAAQQARAERTELTQDVVVEGLLAEARLAGEGSSHSARVAAWTALGKHLGMFKERVEHTGKNGGPIQYAQTTDADLDAEIQRLQGV